jgi:hypothetical protein
MYQAGLLSGRYRSCQLLVLVSLYIITVVFQQTPVKHLEERSTFILYRNPDAQSQNLTRMRLIEQDEEGSKVRTLIN